MKRIFIFSGEQSGDLHGSHLVKALKKDLPGVCIEGVVGHKMHAEGVTPILRIEDFEVMGITDVLLAIPKLYKQFYFILDRILSFDPEAVILIDYPGFNLRLAKALRKKGYRGKLIQYVAPTVWAHGKHRVEHMAKVYDLLITIYPFESAYFKNTDLQVSYAGNPLCDYIKNHNCATNWKALVDMPESDSLVSLFPGSRESEIKRNLPILLEAADKLKQKHSEIIFGVSCSHSIVNQILNKKRHRFQSLQDAIFCVPKEYTYELMRSSCLAAAKSGTVALELALHGCPSVVIYKLTTLNRFYAKYILKLQLPHYCIVNILAGQRVFPELIEKDLSAKNLMEQLSTLYSEKKLREKCIDACHSLHASLNKGDASRQAVNAILNLT